MTPRKRQKGDDNMAEEDRISNLPDLLLDKILSCLPTKDAFATSIISKRWRLSFTWLTTLDFDDSPICHCLHRPHHIDYFPLFTSFVDNVLQACQSQNLTTFRLHFGTRHMVYCEQGCFADLEPVRAYSWMCFPLARGVRELDISIHTKKPGKIPSALYNCPTLEVLKLDVIFDLEVPSTLCLPNLKELLLTVWHFPGDDSVTRLVSSCPSLEHLAMEGGLIPSSPISISSPSLRRLAILIPVYYRKARSKLVLDVPNLEYLEHFDTVAWKYSIGDLSSLVEARFDVAGFYSSIDQLENMFSVVNSFSYARRLFLMQGCMQVLDAYKLEYKLPIFRNLNHLQLGCDNYFYWNKLLLELLNFAPFLETLAFPEGIVYDVDETVDVYVMVSEQECQSWSKTRVTPSCLEFHLKRISIMRYEGTEWELAMVKYLLKNALVLEELVIVCATLVPSTDKILLDSTLHTLQKLPRGSTTCSIEVQ